MVLGRGVSDEGFLYVTEKGGHGRRLVYMVLSRVVTDKGWFICY